MDIKNTVRSIQDFPKPGINFYDISPLLRSPEAWQHTMHLLTNTVKAWHPDLLAGIESRGFLTAAPLALKLNCGFVMIRKRNKLPGPTIHHTYDLEYGSDTVEIQKDAIEPGQRVVVLDDLLATGGTARAAIDLLKKVGANVVGFAAIIELNFLRGRHGITVPVETLVGYDH